MPHLARRLSAVVAAVAAGLAGQLCAATPAVAADTLELRSLSSRPDMVSAGDALVELRVPDDVAPAAVELRLDGDDRTADLAAVGGDERLRRGAVGGLADGVNSLTASAPGHPDARLLLVGHPRTGPILSGPHQAPFTCKTAESGFGPPLDADCSLATRVNFAYRSTGGDLLGLPDPSVLPPDVAQTTTTDGATVPYVIRVETGTLNRAIYQTAVLVDPDRPDEAGSGWNGKLVYAFGGGCKAGYDQGLLDPAARDDNRLGLGYGVASSSLNVFANRCSDAVSAETVSMVKERFVEQYGPVRFTIGSGGSGGAMAQYMIDENYPGLLDGSLTNNSFPDNVYGGDALMDCRLIDLYHASATVPWTAAQKRAVKGFNMAQSCQVLWAGFGRNYFNPSFCAALTPAQAYDPVTGVGARCTIWDGNLAVYGTDPLTGFARRPVDNVGVRYGLEALRDGTITIEQFLDLNERAGGLDIDGNRTAERTAADPLALRIAYERGQLVSGAAGLSHTPMIDNRNFANESQQLQGHHIVQPLAAHDRIARANGGDPGPHVLWTHAGNGPGSGLEVMDAWLTGIAGDASGDPPRVKALRHRPPEAVDACFTADGTRVDEPASFDAGTCGALYPTHPVPRMVAGGPLSNDVLKCQLEPIDPADYGVALTTAELERLAAVFPDGVCDFSRPGVEQLWTSDTWRVYPVDASDAVAPDTAIGSAPPDTGAAPDPAFTFSATETGATFACSVDGGAFEPCSSPHRVDGLPDGPHAFSVRAVDHAGNVDDTPARMAFRVGAPPADPLPPFPPLPPRSQEEQPSPPASAPSGSDQVGGRPGPAPAPPALAELDAATPVSRHGGETVYSVRVREGRYRLVHHDGERAATLPVRPRSVPFDADLGPGLDGRLTVVYSRCAAEPSNAGGRALPTYVRGRRCDVHRHVLGRAGERRVGRASTRRRSEVLPAIWRGRIAFVRTGRERRADRLLVTRLEGRTRTRRVPAGSRRAQPLGIDLYGSRVASLWRRRGAGGPAAIELARLGADRGAVVARAAADTTLTAPAFDDGFLYAARGGELLRHRLATGEVDRAPLEPAGALSLGLGAGVAVVTSGPSGGFAVRALALAATAAAFSAQEGR